MTFLLAVEALLLLVLLCQLLDVIIAFTIALDVLAACSRARPSGAAASRLAGATLLARTSPRPECRCL